jgi:hypothetical protein
MSRSIMTPNNRRLPLILWRVATVASWPRFEEPGPGGSLDSWVQPIYTVYIQLTVGMSQFEELLDVKVAFRESRGRV